MEIKSLASELNTNSYPGRGIVLGQKCRYGIFYNGQKCKQP